MKLQVVSTVVLACPAISLDTGCASNAASRSLTDTSSALEAPIFIAPLDPTMGRFVRQPLAGRPSMPSRARRVAPRSQ